MEDKERFKNWLISNKDYSTKSAGDVISRLNRIDMLIKLDLNDNEIKLVYLLDSNAQFLQLSNTVRSQLRRAIRLYKDFIRSEK